MTRARRLALLLTLLCPAASAVASGTFAAQVDPFIGTDGTGHVFPGATMPFGMVQPGPDNADRGWDYSSGYQYRAPRILGFSNTHISGAGIPELGDVLLQPASGTPWTADADRPPFDEEGSDSGAPIVRRASESPRRDETGRKSGGVPTREVHTFQGGLR